MKNSTAKSWDPIWDNVFENQNWGKYPSESLIRFVARNYYSKNRGTIKILEIGCGPGANIWYLSREGFAAYGIDGSEIAIQQAQERMNTEGLKADLMTGDILELPYANETFDAVIDVECLYANSLHNASKILEEVSRVLKNNGQLYSRTFSTNMYIGQSTDQKEFAEVVDGPMANKGFTRLMNPEDIRNLYSPLFKIKSIDLEEATQNNGETITSEHVIICQKL